MSKNRRNYNRGIKLPMNFNYYLGCALVFIGCMLFADIMMNISEKENSTNEVISSSNVSNSNSYEFHTTEFVYGCDNTLEEQIGDSVIKLDNISMVKHDLPNKYYEGIDFSSFQPFMSYDKITDTTAPAWDIVNSENSYTDEFGLRRYKVSEDQFSINGQDDYLIALGTFYKDKGVVGNRYLIITSNGAYTATTGDEKSDAHTDKMNMFTTHTNGTAGVIEWIVDWDNLDPTIKRSGTVTIGGPDVVKGEILYIYEIK